MKTKIQKILVSVMMLLAIGIVTIEYSIANRGLCFLCDADASVPFHYDPIEGKTWWSGECEIRSTGARFEICEQDVINDNLMCRNTGSAC